MVSDKKIIKYKFEILFNDHFAGLCYFARKYLGDMDNSKEIVHNVFLNLWENRDAFDWEKPAKSYLFTAVYNRCINYIRDNKKFASTEEVEKINADSQQFSDQMETAELEQSIKNALMKLPEKCKQIFELSRFEEKKYIEIADLLNISLKTVEAQMSKALKILREELKDYLIVLFIWFLINYGKFLK